METLPPEFVLLWRRPVPLAVLDQYVSAALSGVLANPDLVREAHAEAALKKVTPFEIMATAALACALASIKARLDLWPEPVQKP